jgi:hypothetical protein
MRIINTCFVIASLAGATSACALEPEQTMSGDEALGEDSADLTVDRSDGVGGELTVIPNATGNCMLGNFCVWTDSPFQGRFAQFAVGARDLRTPIGGFVFDNLITDVWNRTNVPWTLFESGNCAGATKTIPANQPQGVFVFEFNDRTSSLKRSNSTACP